MQYDTNVLVLPEAVPSQEAGLRGEVRQVFFPRPIGQCRGVDADAHAADGGIGAPAGHDMQVDALGNGG